MAFYDSDEELPCAEGSGDVFEDVRVTLAASFRPLPLFVASEFVGTWAIAQAQNGKGKSQACSRAVPAEETVSSCEGPKVQQGSALQPKR